MIDHPISGRPTGRWLKKHLEKYEFVNGKDDIPHIMEKKQMFETVMMTNRFGRLWV